MSLSSLHHHLDVLINSFVVRYANKEHTATTDDVGEVSSTSKSEQPVDEPKEQQDDPISHNLVKEEDLVEVTEEDLFEVTEEPCDKNGATNTSLDEDDDDLMILS